MSDASPIRQWLEVHLDDLAATVFIAVVVAALVGFIKRSTGAAVFVSCACSAMLVLIAFPWLSDIWDWKKLVPVLGAAAGVCSVGLFKIAMKVGDRLGERDTELADKIINKGASFIPGDGSAEGKP